MKKKFFVCFWCLFVSSNYAVVRADDSVAKNSEPLIIKRDAIQRQSTMEAAMPSGVVSPLPFSTSESASLPRLPQRPDITSVSRTLPGAQIRERSGTGSLTSFVSPLALSSSDTQMTIAQLPVINPLGTGFNFSLLPMGLVHSLQWQGPFNGMNLQSDSWDDTRSAPSGRLNIDLSNRVFHSSGHHSAAKFGGAYSPSVGETIYPGTGRIHGSYFRRMGEQSTLGLGLMGQTTDGRYGYQDSVSHEAKNRAGNDSTYFGGMSSFETRSEDGAKELNLIALGTHGSKRISGSLFYPQKDWQLDDFHFMGARGKLNAFYSKLSLTHNRVGIRDQFLKTVADDRTYGTYGQVGWEPLNGWQLGSLSFKPNLSFDHEYHYYLASTGHFNRQIYGVTAQSKIQFKSLYVTPLVRNEWGTQLESTQWHRSGIPDFRIRVGSDFASENGQWDFSGGYAFDHLYPNITARSGYRSSYGLMRPNLSLSVERHRIWSLGAAWSNQFYSISVRPFYSRASRRAMVSFYQDGTAQFVESPEVELYGSSFDLTAELSQWVALRSSVTVQRSTDLSVHRDMPYKPIWLTQSGIDIHYKKLAWQNDIYAYGRQRYLGVDAAADAHVPANWIWSQQISYAVNAVHHIYWRVQNLLNRRVLDAPGYPEPGRTYWIGYEHSAF